MPPPLDDAAPFASRYALAWTYHRNTCRWPHNLHGAVPFVREGPKEYTDAPYTPLPPPETPEASFADVLASRHSCRQYRDVALPLSHLSTCLYWAYGATGVYAYGSEEVISRGVPSGGSLYPLELYLLARNVEGAEPGIYHYAPLAHGLEQVRTTPLPAAYVGDVFLHQPYVGHASAVLVIAAMVDRSMRKYEDRGYRYILFEAGHVAQNLNLMAAALGLGALNLGGFYDDEVVRLAGLDPNAEVPLYGVALGIPETDDPVRARLT